MNCKAEYKLFSRLKIVISTFAKKGLEKHQSRKCGRRRKEKHHRLIFILYNYSASKFQRL